MFTRSTSISVFVVNLEHISYTFSSVSIVHFQQANVCYEYLNLFGGERFY